MDVTATTDLINERLDNTAPKTNDDNSTLAELANTK